MFQNIGDRGSSQLLNQRCPCFRETSACGRSLIAGLIVGVDGLKIVRGLNDRIWDWGVYKISILSSSKYSIEAGNHDAVSFLS